MKVGKKKVAVKKTVSKKIVSVDKAVIKKKAIAKKKGFGRAPNLGRSAYLRKNNPNASEKIDGKRRKGSQTRARILIAAERQFMLNGYYKTRFEDIAKELDIVASAVVYHFSDKRALYFAVLENVFNDLFVELKRALAGSGTLQERFENMVYRAVECAANRPATAFFILREAGTIDNDVRAKMQQVAAPFIDLLQMVYEEGIRTGSIDPQSANPLHFLSFFAGTVCFYISATPNIAENIASNHMNQEQIELLANMIIQATDSFIGFKNS